MGAFGVAHDVGHVEHLRLERTRWRQELKEVVTLLSRDLGVRPRREVRQGDMVYGDLDPLLRAPVLGVLVEPRVVGRDEMTPLNDLERLLRPLDQDGGAKGHGGRRGAGRGDELPPIHPFPPGHGSILPCSRAGSGVRCQVAVST